MSDALEAVPRGLSFRERCWSVDFGCGPFEEAAAAAREVLRSAVSRKLYVVVDNLEELHIKLQDYREVVTALFRVASRQQAAGQESELPFRIRFAFPAELLEHLQGLTANAEKDFQDQVIIRWSAAELIVIAGNRLRTFLDLRFPAAPRALGLRAQHNPASKVDAEATLRAVLPREITNGLGGPEDTVAYLLRHTQLLPRQLIMILNQIMRRVVSDLDAEDVPVATAANVVAGVHDAEGNLVTGILGTYAHDYSQIGPALRLLKDRIGMVEPVSNLHQIYNAAGIQHRLQLDFGEFLDAALAIGAFGIQMDMVSDWNARYVVGEFSYTLVDEVRSVEDEDSVCVHPLFISRLFDRHRLVRLAKEGMRPVYPYGSDPAHDLPDV